MTFLSPSDVARLLHTAASLRFGMMGAFSRRLRHNIAVAGRPTVKLCFVILEPVIVTCKKKKKKKVSECKTKCKT